MNREQIIYDVLVDAGEWLEMSDNPNEMIVWILAGKIEKLNNHINYLEKRLEHDGASKSRIN